jgi:hypothetical protein
MDIDGLKIGACACRVVAKQTENKIRNFFMALIVFELVVVKGTKTYDPKINTLTNDSKTKLAYHL